MEKKLIKMFNGKPCKDYISGDCIIAGENVEIKISLGDNKGGFNFVQIRPAHNIDYYLILVYDMLEENFGKCYWFIIPEAEMIKFILKYPSYAHGTKQKLGKPTIDNIKETNNEYAIRCNSHKKGKPLEIWNYLKKFETSIDKLHELFSSNGNSIRTSTDDLIDDIKKLTLE